VIRFEGDSSFGWVCNSPSSHQLRYAQTPLSSPWKAHDILDTRPAKGRGRVVAEGLFGELRMKERIGRLNRTGIDVNILIEYLTKLGDPYAIELLYLLDEEEQWARLLEYT